MTQTKYQILHVLPWTSVGGTEQATLRIARATSGREFVHTALCLNNAAEVRSMFAEAGFETLGFDAVEPSYRRPRAFLAASLKLSQQIRARGISLIHCADVLAAHYTALAGRMAGTPVLCHVRNRFEQISWRDRSFLRAVNRFAFVSQNTWKHFALRVPPRNGTIIYDGIEAQSVPGCKERQQTRCEFGLPDDAKVIGMVARIAPQKDYATLVKAAARVIQAEPQARFLIVGDYAQTEAHRAHFREVQALMAAHKVTDHFIFTGYRADVSRLIGAMDLFALSTHCEGLPLVILEAMAQGRPVVATEVDGVPEIVRHNQTGLLFAHEDDQRLAEHLIMLLHNEARREELGRAGRQVVINEFSRERFACNMAKLYLTALRESSKQNRPGRREER